MKTSYRANTDTHAAQAAAGAQNQELFLVRTEGIPGHKTLLKQPGERQTGRRKLHLGSCGSQTPDTHVFQGRNSFKRNAENRWTVN